MSRIGKALASPVAHIMLVLVAMVSVLSIAWLCAPRTALAADPTNGKEYSEEFMSTYGMGDGAEEGKKGLKSMDFDVYGEEGTEVLPNFHRITDTVSGAMLAFIPVLFVIKFAGRAMLNLTHSGSGKLDIPTFFMAAEERAQGPSGGAKEGTSWYLMMAKDFLRYFGVAVAVWAIFNAIIMGVNFAFDLTGAESTEGQSFVSQFGKSTGA